MDGKIDKSIISMSVYEDFPGGPVVKNSPCNAEDVGSIPGWEIKIPHAMEQPSPQTLWHSCTAAMESACHNRGSHMKKQRSCVPQLRPDADK